MKLFDSHCHLDAGVYDKDIDEVITRANDTGVEAMMIVGTDRDSSVKAVSMAERRNGLYASVGVHPHDAGRCNEEALEFLQTLAKKSCVKAWGETGLDFNRMYSPRKDQEKWFTRQIEIAGKLKLPIIFHERDSEGRFIDIMETHFNNEKGGVVHCFSGNTKELYQYLDLGLYIGITGILTIKARGAELRKMIQSIPPEKILIETDAPYLTPAPQKNSIRRNEPAFVKSVLLKLAEVMGEAPHHLAGVIWENTCRLYTIAR